MTINSNYSWTGGGGSLVCFPYVPSHVEGTQQFPLTLQQDMLLSSCVRAVALVESLRSVERILATGSRTEYCTGNLKTLQ